MAMKAKQAKRIAIEAMEREAQLLAVNANLYENYLLQATMCKRAYQQRTKLLAAIELFKRDLGKECK